MSDFNYTMTDALNEDITRANALMAYLCEKNGMTGVRTYRIQELDDIIRARKLHPQNNEMIIL